MGARFFVPVGGLIGYAQPQVEAGKTARGVLPGNGCQPVWTITVLFYR
jgi:hypothetical protein